MKNYKVVNGTSYDERTPDEVIRVLENARFNRTRLHISLGETDDDRGQLGRDWLEENDVYGFIGRSTGSNKIPLLIHNRRSLGGFGLLDHCIVKIRLSAGRGRVLYQHPNYHFGKMEIRRKSVPVELSDGRTLTIEVLRDGQEQAAFDSVAKAVRYIKKLGVVAPISA
jgi:hypothetical protein